MQESNSNSQIPESEFLTMKRQVVRQALMSQWSKLSDQELEQILKTELVGSQSHVREMMIHLVSEDFALELSDQEVNEFLLNVD